MALSAMMRIGEDALQCDMAETYGIYDMRALPLRYVATLACGLRADARIMQKLAGFKEEIPPTDLLLVQLIDSVNLLLWVLAGKSKEQPETMFSRLFKERKEKHGYMTGAEFEEAREKLLRKNDGE